MLGLDGKPLTDIWLAVIWAFRGAYGDTVKHVLRQWSKTSNRYDRKGFEDAWNAYDPDHVNPVGIGSILHFSRAHGWVGSAPADLPPVPSTTRYHLLDRAAILAIEPIEWRVKGLFPMTGIGVIFGPSGSGKSFLALYLCFCFAFGRAWFGRRTRACVVTYVMLEGEAGLRNRVVALSTFEGGPIPENFRAITQAFELSNPQDVADLAAILPQGGVVIIDTLNRAAPGLDENASRDMGLIVGGMKRLQELTKGLVLAVHHTGKDPGRGMRGHSSLHAALDCAIEVTRADNRRAWSAAKVKDGEDGLAVPFKLHVVELGNDSDGDIITSCVVAPDADGVPLRREPSGKAQQAALSTIRRALGRSSDIGQGGCGPQTPCMSVNAAISEYAATLVTVDPNRRMHRAKGRVQDLITDAHLRTGVDDVGESWVWCP
ncbi:AAA family ATPase [Novosphingobium sp.]|uniref:AAA family ATPase n=1 Tax=Novosphingobium sp. TaxID=1874826 RepID=UPI003B51EFF8